MANGNGLLKDIRGKYGQAVGKPTEQDINDRAVRDVNQNIQNTQAKYGKGPIAPGRGANPRGNARANNDTRGSR